MWRKRRGLILVFTFWFAISPMVVSIAQANDMPEPSAPGERMPQPIINTEQLPDGIVSMDQVVKPVEYLNSLREAKGDKAVTTDTSFDGLLHTRADLDRKAQIDRAWADWMMTMGNIYTAMDDGCHEVFSYYESMAKVKKVYKLKNLVTETQAIEKGAELAVHLAKAAETTAFGFVFLEKTAVGAWGKNLFAGFAQNLVRGSKAMEKAIHSSKTLKFLEHMMPPPCWNNPKVAGEGFKSYYKWVKRITHTESKAEKGRFVINNSKGVARTIGIGLAVLTVALDAYHLATSDDTHGGRWSSFDTVKTLISGALGLAILVCMFCPPPFGQIFAAAALIWFVVTEIGAFLGSYNKRWKEAYKNSYWFLHEQDLQFKSFYDNRSALKQEEKAASLLMAEQKFGKMVDEQRPMQKNEDEQKDFDRGRLVFEAMEKQGVLMSYYSRGDFTMPDLELERLLELWHKKADMMSWKPTEKEAEKAQKRGFWGKVLHAVNPMTYVAWAGDKIQSRGYNKEIAENNMPRVWFNPDFYLLKKYQNYLLLKRARGKLYDLVSLRIEQAPFNYIPLVGIDTAAWTPELLGEAFRADSLMVGQKEMVVFRNFAKTATAQIKQTYDQFRDRLRDYKNNDFAGELEVRIDALMKLGQAFKTAPDTAADAVFTDCEKAFGWTWNSANGPKTPKKIIYAYRPYIEQTLQMLPVTNGYQAGEFMQMQETVQANADTAAIMEHMGQVRLKASQSIEQEYKSAAIKKYLREGTFLDVKGSTFMDWLGEVYPAAEELRKFSDLFLDEVKKYKEEVEDFKNSDVGQILAQTNDSQTKLKEMVALWASIASAAQIRVVVKEDDKQVFPGGGYNLPAGIEVLDPTKPIGDPDSPANQPAGVQAAVPDVTILYPPGM